MPRPLVIYCALLLLFAPGCDAAQLFGPIHDDAVIVVDGPPQEMATDTSAGDAGPALSPDLPSSCFDEGCEQGSYCDPTTLVCKPVPQGTDPHYEAINLMGFGAQGGRDGPGLEATGGAAGAIVDPAGRFFYIMAGGRTGNGQVLRRYDAVTQQVETIAGMGAPGYIDGPGDSALFDYNHYQAGGFGFSHDAKRLIFIDQQDMGGAVRSVNLDTFEVETLGKGQVGVGAGGKVGIRALSVGRETGTVYVIGWGGAFYLIKEDGTVEQRSVEWPSAVGYIAADEARGALYGLDRNSGGPLYRWALTGGAATLLNSDGVKRERTDQYISDGPVVGMATANPSFLHLGQDGYLYIGGGDSRTFRRYDPDAEWVLSLCTNAKGQYHFCIGDDKNNKPFHTWTHHLTFDDAGNGYLFYSVWPRGLTLRRVP